LADLEVLGRSKIRERVREMVRGGIRWIQIRAKQAVDSDLAADLESCSRALEGLDVTLWINDRPDLARLYRVDGVHLGQGDLPPAAARDVVGAHGLIGRSTHRDEEVREADADRAVDLIAIGPVFATTGKRDPEAAVGLEGVRRARRLTAKPLVAIGGIDDSNLLSVLEAGADSVAVLGAVCVGDVEANSRRLVARAGGLT
jgi:thiamine-phosphate pyrophosphorylase